MAMFVISRRLTSRSQKTSYLSASFRCYSTSFREERDTFGPIQVPSANRLIRVSVHQTTPTTRSISIVDHELPYDSHNTYDVLFFSDSIHTTVTHDPNVSTQWISEVESTSLVVGLDIEWRPSFNRCIKTPAATLQLCVDRRCLIFQLIHAPSIPKSLVDFLANPNYSFVGIGIDQDLKKLKKDYEFGFTTNTVDLRGLAADKYGQPDLKRAGLKGLASIVLQKEFEKPKRVTMSRWDHQWLTPAQVQYACVDAFVCFEIGRILFASSSASG